MANVEEAELPKRVRAALKELKNDDLVELHLRGIPFPSLACSKLEYNIYWYTKFPIWNGRTGHLCSEFPFRMQRS